VPDSFDNAKTPLAFFIEEVLKQRRRQHIDRGNELGLGAHDACHHRIEAGELVVTIVEDPSALLIGNARHCFTESHDLAGESLGTVAVKHDLDPLAGEK